MSSSLNLRDYLIKRARKASVSDAFSIRYLDFHQIIAQFTMQETEKVIASLGMKLMYVNEQMMVYTNDGEPFATKDYVKNYTSKRTANAANDEEDEVERVEQETKKLKISTSYATSATSSDAVYATFGDELRAKTKESLQKTVADFKKLIDLTNFEMPQNINKMLVSYEEWKKRGLTEAMAKKIAESLHLKLCAVKNVWQIERNLFYSKGE